MHYSLFGKFHLVVENCLIFHHVETDKFFNLQFKATSEYSVRTEGIPNYMVQSMTIYIRGVYLPGFEVMGSMMMTALAAAAIVGGRKQEDIQEVSEDGTLRPLDSRIF